MDELLKAESDWETL
jgi:vacuolar-type H+-ATPase subunit C/Vma6